MKSMPFLPTPKSGPQLQDEKDVSSQSDSVKLEYQAPWHTQTWLQKVRTSFIEYRQWWLLCLLVLCAFSLWYHVGYIHYVPAQATLRVHTIRAPQEGTLHTLTVRKGMSIARGQALGALDPTALTLQHKLARLEKKRLEELIASQAIALRLSDLSLRAQLHTAVSKSKTSWLQGRTRWHSSQAELRAINKELRRLKHIRTGRLGRSSQLGALEARQQSLQAWLKAMPRILRMYRRKHRVARSLYNQVRKTSGNPTQKTIQKRLRPLQLQWEMQALRIRQLALRLKKLKLHTPVDGIVQTIYQRTGDRVVKGAPIAEVVQNNRDEVMAYVAQDQARHVHLGMTVRLALQYPQPNARYWFTAPPTRCARIVGLSAMAPIPLRFRTLPQKPRWVRAITLRLTQPYPMIPGEALWVHLQPGRCGR